MIFPIITMIILIYYYYYYFGGCRWAVCRSVSPGGQAVLLRGGGGGLARLALAGLARCRRCRDGGCDFFADNLCYCKPTPPATPSFSPASPGRF